MIDNFLTRFFVYKLIYLYKTKRVDIKKHLIKISCNNNNIYIKCNNIYEKVNY